MRKDVSDILAELDLYILFVALYQFVCSLEEIVSLNRLARLRDRSREAIDPLLARRVRRKKKKSVTVYVAEERHLMRVLQGPEHVCMSGTRAVRAPPFS